MKTQKNCIERLSKYRDTLYRLRSMGFVKVFSDNLADAVGVASSQVRKDFSIFGLSGNKKGGYVIDDLVNKINGILGKNEVQKIIVAGVGNIGKALMHYTGFESRGIKIVAAFDKDQAKINRTGMVPVLPLDELKDFLAEHPGVKVGVVAVPEAAAQQVVDQMISAGIKGILNFAPIRLNIPPDFIVNDVNVGLELETVIYFVNALDKETPHARN